jgi:prophage regulatory protein
MRWPIPPPRPTPTPEPAFYRLKEVIRICALSRSTIYRRIAEGRFPMPVHLGGHASGWSTAALKKWIEDPEGYRVDALSTATGRGSPAKRSATDRGRIRRVECEPLASIGVETFSGSYQETSCRPKLSSLGRRSRSDGSVRIPAASISFNYSPTGRTIQAVQSTVFRAWPKPQPPYLHQFPAHQAGVSRLGASAERRPTPVGEGLHALPEALAVD